MTATLPCSRSGMVEFPLARRDEDVLYLGEGVRGIRPQLTAQARGLESAERRPIPHRRMRIDRDVARLDAPADPDSPTDIAGPDRTGQAELGVVRDSNRIGLVLEGDN